MKNCIYICLSVLLSALMCFSCGGGEKDDLTPDDPVKPTDPNNPDKPIVDFLDPSLLVIQFKAGADASLLTIKTNESWSISGGAEWLSLTANTGQKNTTVVVGCKPNTGFKRTATLTVKSGKLSKSVSIEQKPVEKMVFSINSTQFVLRLVEADTTMLFPPYFRGYDYKVYISTFYVSETEITNAQWEAVTGNVPKQLDKLFPQMPVVVNWNEIDRQFLPRVQTLGKLNLRLPTEHEWYLAAIGGIEPDNFDFAGSSNRDEVAWHYLNSNGAVSKVATKKPNKLGLYDMSGNVTEWCLDWYEESSGDEQRPTVPPRNPKGPDNGTERLLKGGDCRADRFEYDSNSCNLSRRHSLPPNVETPTDDNTWLVPNFTGFRLVYSSAN